MNMFNKYIVKKTKLADKPTAPPKPSVPQKEHSLEEEEEVASDTITELESTQATEGTTTEARESSEPSEPSVPAEPADDHEDDALPEKEPSPVVDTEADTDDPFNELDESEPHPDTVTDEATVPSSSEDQASTHTAADKHASVGNEDAVPQAPATESSTDTQPETQVKTTKKVDKKKVPKKTLTGPKRHAKKPGRTLRQVVTQSAIKRWKLRCGVPRLEAAAKDAIRHVFYSMMKANLHKSMIIKEYRRRKILEKRDILEAARMHQMTLYY
jgi:hypothetical protein